MMIKRLLRRPLRRYLEWSVKRLLKANPAVTVVAISGSVGKTSTKFAVATVLAQAGRVLSNHTNYNSEFGVPLAIFEQRVPDRLTDLLGWLSIVGQVERRLRRPWPYDRLVLELGTDRPGDLDGFWRYLQPAVGIVTAITPEHMENFLTLEAVAAEEFSLALHSRGVALPAADPELMTRRPSLGDRPVTTYGSGGEVDWVGGDDRIRLGQGQGAPVIGVRPQLLGDHLRQSLLAAAAVAIQLDMDPEAIRAGIDMVAPVPGRMQRLAGREGSQLIDDSYNSSPAAALAALKTLASFGKGRKIALLGQMNELGRSSRSAHEQVGAAAAELDLLVTLGGDANSVLGPAAVAAGLPPERWRPFTSPYAAGEYLAGIIRGGDVVLVKGSQNGVFAEEALKRLLADPTDEARLVRQSPAWLAKKRAQFADAPDRLARSSSRFV